ncbi:unnamed protein product [Pleuronectes platessa]|uniref:Uncharacterized protein n=1 Tax=Pleuronectes platessa TaxID=8262 RepID=A0A9N7YX10_PLEPL|nr:unnamed protein product [Pleuronectes platessa]
MSLLKQRGRELERFDGLSLIYWYVKSCGCWRHGADKTSVIDPKLPELWDYFLIYVSGALEFNPDCRDIDLGMFPLRMNPTIKDRESRYMALDERANASRAPPARLAREPSYPSSPG